MRTNATQQVKYISGVSEKEVLTDTCLSCYIERVHTDVLFQYP